MGGRVNHAGWSVRYSVPDLANGGLHVHEARFHDISVLYEGSQPFSLSVYHDRSHVSFPPHENTVYKDGLGYETCGSGSPYRAVSPLTPNGPALAENPSFFSATNDSEFSFFPPNLFGAVVVERLEAGLAQPAKLVLWTKFQMNHYQFVHRWEFHSDGSIEVKVGLGGELNITDDHAGAHLHHFYFRLDLDIGSASNNAVQRFEHTTLLPNADAWTTITTEAAQRADPARYTKWRVVNKTPKPNGRLRSYELLPAGEGAPDGYYSTSDVWALRYQPEGERGRDVACTDEVLTNNYISRNGRSIDGADVVIWYCLHHHHEPRQHGEERQLVPYTYLGFRLEPRDFLDDSPAVAVNAPTGRRPAIRQRVTEGRPASKKSRPQRKG
jgi:hypothetical protein